MNESHRNTFDLQPLGTGDATKSDGFSEKFQTAFNSAPSFSENYITILKLFRKFIRFGSVARP